MFHRSSHKAGFTVIDNCILSGGLSLDARGLLATILSLPDDWQFSERGLCRIVPDGRRRVHGALLELERAGYIVRSGQGRDQAGRMTAQTWEVFESPQAAADARNATTDATRQEAVNPQVATDVQSAQADASRDNAPFDQVATDVRLPFADTVHQCITKDESLTIKGGAADAAAGDAAPPRPACPRCGSTNDVRCSGGLLTCSCGTAWRG